MKNLFLICFCIFHAYCVFAEQSLGSYVFNTTYPKIGKATLDGKACLPVYLGTISDNELKIPIYAVFESRSNKTSDLMWSFPIENSKVYFTDENTLCVDMPNGRKVYLTKHSDYYKTNIQHNNPLVSAARSFFATEKKGNIIEMTNDAGWSLIFKKGRLVSIKYGTSLWKFRYSAKSIVLNNGRYDILTINKDVDTITVKNGSYKYLLKCDSINSKNFNVLSISGDCNSYSFEKTSNCLVYSLLNSKQKKITWNDEGVLDADNNSDYIISYDKNTESQEIESITKASKNSNDTSLFVFAEKNAATTEVHRNGILTYAVKMQPAYNWKIRDYVYHNPLKSSKITERLYYDKAGFLWKKQAIDGIKVTETEYDSDGIIINK